MQNPEVDGAAEERSYYRGLSSPEVCSPFAHQGSLAAAAEDEPIEEGWDEEEEDEELELGLSLGAKIVGKGSKGPAFAAGGGPGGTPGPWGEYCRILTAKDFPPVVGSRVSPMSSSSSVSSSSSMGGTGGYGGDDDSGIKRAANAATPSQVVGWPPIRAFRINSLFNHSKDNSPEDSHTDHLKKPISNTDNTCDNSGSKNSSIQENAIDLMDRGKKKPSTFFVKVNMDGMPIGRKVDLNAHKSYDALALTLEDMFQQPPILKANPIQVMRTSMLLDGSSEFVLTYEDKDGDWMLIGDVPYGMFLKNVRRLRIMRTSDANGLAPRFQSNTVGLRRSKPI